MAGKKHAAFFGDSSDRLAQVFDRARRARIEELTDLRPGVIGSRDFDERAPDLQDLEVVFATWGAPTLRSDQVARLPALRAFFYAAGTVQSFARPYLERGVRVASAWTANAQPVAEFALAQIILSAKGYFRNVRDYAGERGGRPFVGRGSYGETVALLGAGAVARRLIALLSHLDLRVVVYDPYLSEEAARTVGVRRVSLEEAFEQGYVVSNHVPNLPSTTGMIGAPLLGRMRENATFINTGRGASVVEADLIRVMRERPDLTALLDVTWPEPPPADSLLFDLPNVRLSSHIAGSKGDEVTRMADMVIEELIRWQKGEPLQHEVTLEMLERMA
jgi:phosphoglycerate dehydrogenase-like enzyme